MKNRRKVALSHISRAVRQREQKGIFSSIENGDLKGQHDDAADRKLLVAPTPARDRSGE